MTFNKLNFERRSGRNTHRFLIKEVYRIFKRRGYNVFIEYKIDKNRNYKADVFAIKKKEKVIIECMSKPSKSYITEKLKRYKKYCDKIVMVYPSTFIPTIPLEEYFDEVLQLDIPIGINEEKILITVSNELWKKLNDLKTPESKTFEEVIERLILK